MTIIYKRNLLSLFCFIFALLSCGTSEKSEEPDPLVTKEPLKKTKPTCKEAKSAWEAFLKEPSTRYCQDDEDCFNIGEMENGCDQELKPGINAYGFAVSYTKRERAKQLVKDVIQCKEWVPHRIPSDGTIVSPLCLNNLCTVNVGSCFTNP